MNQLPKYTWLIETIRRAGKISHKELSDKWQCHKELSDCRPLHRATFNRWREAIYDQFSIMIECQKTGGYLYYIANPQDLDEDKLKKWMLDSYAVGNVIGENLSLKGRILVDEIPSGRDHLTTILEAMKDNRVMTITYRPFKKSHGLTRRDTDGQPTFPEVWTKIEDKIEGLPLVAHNRPFDESCLKAVFEEYGMEYPDYEFHCTLAASCRCLDLPSHQLHLSAAACGYNMENHHHALCDAEACAAILKLL